MLLDKFRIEKILRILRLHANEDEEKKIIQMFGCSVLEVYLGLFACVVVVAIYCLVLNISGLFPCTVFLSLFLYSCASLHLLLQIQLYNWLRGFCI